MGLASWMGFNNGEKLVGKTLFLRPPAKSDWAAWSRLRQRSRAFLEPWEPIWPADDLTSPAFSLRIRQVREETARGDCYTFLLFRNRDSLLVGGLSLGNVRRGVTQTATLGYWMAEEFSGQGFMREGVDLALDFAFKTLRLHRVEAACLPRNQRSSRLLTRLGFKHEGLARAYLQINGVWEDHLLFAILASDVRQG